MKRYASQFLSLLVTTLAGSLGLCSSHRVLAQPDPNWLGHDRSRPLPPIVDPGTSSTQEQPGKPPSDATVLFNGTDLSQWVSLDGSPTKWVVNSGAMECVPGSGYVRTLQSFGDCQLHIEWSAPTPAKGEGQGRGNSGVFLGLDRYEIQVLDSYENKTYADGSAASIYNQYPPLVNVTRPPGQWQSYDIIWTAPRFAKDGTLTSPALVTVLHNGVLVQNNVRLAGPTTWLTRPAYSAHPEKLPIAFQDHGNPVRFRNIWVRELGNPGKKEYLLPNRMLESYVGDYQRDRTDVVKVRRAPDGMLSVTFSGATFLMSAESPTKFFAKTTDVQCEFQFTETDKVAVLSVGEGAMRAKRVN